MNRRESRFLPWLLALFFCSGVAGLGYQVIWAKQLGAGIGHEYPATLAVITAYMSGMVLGALAFERLPGRLQNANSAYACLEIVIGFWGALVAGLSPALNSVIVRLIAQDGSPAAHWTIVFGAIFFSLLPATAAMGATLPAMQRLVSSSAERSWTGLLYGVNTGGAMFGALAAAFWIIPEIGLRNASFAFAGLNAACGLGALAIASQSGARTFLSASISRKTCGHQSPRFTLTLRLFFTGLLGIGFETLMIRALSHVLESTIYTFSVVLAAYLLATALGAFARQRFPMVSFNALLGGSALACLVSAILLRWAGSIYFSLRVAFGDTLIAVATAESLVALLFFFVPAMLMGATFSALAEASLESRSTLGWSVGLNGLGSALAPAFFGFVLVPAFGLRVALAVVVIGYAALASPRFLLCTLFVPLIATGTDLISRSTEKISFFDEGAMASVAVLESTNSTRVLKVNNRFQMGGTAARIAEERHADIPLLLHPSPKRALFIGLGTGITFATSANYPGLMADGVELLPGVIEAMPLFQENPEILKSVSLRVHQADGRRFVLTTTNRYDVIVGDLFHPAQDGAAFLYTREHFTAVLNCLTEDGLFCQWLPLYQMDLATVDLIANTFRSVFSNAELWLLRFNVDTPAIGLVGWRSRPFFSANLVEQKTAESTKLHEHLRKVALGDTLRLFGCRLGALGTRHGTSLNTDQNPIVLFKAPFITFQSQDNPAARLMTLIERFGGSGEVPVDSDFSKRLLKYDRARDVYLRGLVDESKGDLNSATNLYIESAGLSPDFTSGYAQALGIATTLVTRDPEAARAILRRLIEAQPERPVARQLLEKLNQR